MHLIPKGRRLVQWLVVLVGAASVPLALVWVFQRRLIYIPLSGDVPAAASVLPSAEEVTFPTADGLSLHGWFVPASAAGTTLDVERLPAVIVFNGNAGNRAHRAPLAGALSRNGFSVLLFDYRGYGGNDGRPKEDGLRADALAARRYVTRRPDVDPGRIVYFGESLGAAVAVDIAEEHPPAAIVLRSPFTSLADVGRVHYPFLPVALLLREHYRSIDRMPDIRTPVLVLASREDEIVPFELSRRLYDAAGGPKHMAVIAGGGHNDPELLAGPGLVAEVVRFLSETLEGLPATRPLPGASS
jgi:fermentation-respiration switch protein FrsA (DUF1100 family)